MHLSCPVLIIKFQSIRYFGSLEHHSYLERLKILALLLLVACASMRYPKQKAQVYQPERIMKMTDSACWDIDCLVDAPDFHHRGDTKKSQLQGPGTKPLIFKCAAGYSTGFTNVYSSNLTDFYVREVFQTKNVSLVDYKNTR
eukprot:TRINITY_DN9204_c0_g1_i1.p1 TRINITY_DN9204_c0_g1~~TRINITY_DN9204_c0_g1_i1.p1  ORF type:complete len:142 (-),score=14.70 TRINITY_DN9204_c0_g1_i1:391-816(-)